MKIVIAGAGEVGSHLAKMLSMEYHDIVIIDTNEERLKKLSENADVITCYGSPTSMTTLEKAGIKRSDLFVAVPSCSASAVNIYGTPIVSVNLRGISFGSLCNFL